MSHDSPANAISRSKLVIRNIGLLLSGDLDRPILDADTVVAELVRTLRERGIG